MNHVKEQLLSPSIQQFIRENLHQDIAQLALQKHKYPDYPIPEIIEQIRCLKKAQKKLPTWFVAPNILFKELALEQCSSEETAGYKAKLMQGKSLVDLTGGFGVDTYFFAQRFEKVWHIEPNLALQNLVKHNFEQLKTRNVTFVNQKAADFIQQDFQVDAIFIDPSRRKNENKVFLLDDCEPNLLEILPSIFQKTHQILLKLSPMLDIEQVLKSLHQILDLQQNIVSEVHIVAVRNEVKELLLFLQPQIPTPEPIIKAIDISSASSPIFSFYKSQESVCPITYSKPLVYLIEPSPSILKAGAFKSFAHQHHLHKLHPNSHLYTTENLSKEMQKQIQGRIFAIKAICKYDKKEIRKILPYLKANLNTRNFPDSVEKIRKKLQIQEGGDDYVFATTIQENKLVLLLTQKVN
jgi:hypothetical protein